MKSEVLSRLRRSRAAAKVEECQMRENMQQRQVPFSGQLAVEATLILLELNRTQDSDILEIFLEHELLIRCIHHFFLGSCGSIMLNTVVAFCLEFIRGPQNASIQAVCRLLEEGGIMRRLAHALSSAAAFREAAAQKAKRDEPNPHEHTGLLRKICGELRDAGSMSPEVQERLDAMQCWTEVVLPELEEFAQLEQEPLGGILSLESPSLPVKVDAEFTPEDLRDIDEDLDTEFILDLEKLSQREALVAARKEDAQLQSWHLGGLSSTQDDSAEDRGEWV